MFYSHQLLARKAPLGQIWMAATMHAKINRRSLDKLDIIKICEEILNPAVPMALRLSGILMGGVVIVYQRKVTILLDDVTRLLVEINEAWKVKSVADPTVLPKGKDRAKYEAVTLPDHADVEMEQPVTFSDASITTAKFQRMRLDDLDDMYININPGDDPYQQHHQADAANITLVDDFGSVVAEMDLSYRFERFDIAGDEDTQINLTPTEHPQDPTYNIHPSPLQDEQRQAPTNPQSSPLHGAPLQDDITMLQQTEGQEEQQAKEPSNVAQENEVNAQRRRPTKRKAHRSLTHVIMDDDQIMIPGSTYQSWLHDTSDIVSKRGRKDKHRSPTHSTKIGKLMDLPPVALISGLDNFPAEVHYPAPLMDLWRKSNQPNPAQGSPSSGGISAQAPENPTIHSPPEGEYPHYVQESGPDDFGSQIAPQHVDSIEKHMPLPEDTGFSAPNVALPSRDRTTSVTPTAGQSAASAPSSSSGSGYILENLRQEMQAPSRRSSARQQSSARGSVGNLDPVPEEIPLKQNEDSLNLKRVSEEELNTDQELLMETGPTPTPHPVRYEPPVDKVTQSIRTHLKQHFASPGAPEFESLDQLAFGMDSKKAAQLFYQTCVLATHNFVKVQQTKPYGDILISRGPKM